VIHVDYYIFAIDCICIGVYHEGQGCAYLYGYPSKGFGSAVVIVAGLRVALLSGVVDDEYVIV